jgi:hypothetical protein
VERGAHAALLVSGGLYARLYETQFRTGALFSADREIAAPGVVD